MSPRKVSTAAGLVSYLGSGVQELNAAITDRHYLDAHLLEQLQVVTAASHKVSRVKALSVSTGKQSITPADHERLEAAKCPFPYIYLLVFSLRNYYYSNFFTFTELLTTTNYT